MPKQDPQKVVDSLYEKYYEGDKARHGVFLELANCFTPKRVLYPGGFIHVNASFVFPSVTYVDNDKNAKRFFKCHNEVRALIDQSKDYADPSAFKFYGQSYEDPLDEADGSFDMLISLYAGFISKPCKRYLSSGGILVVNNSHGDAGLASLDDEFTLIGVLKGQGDQYKFSEKNLNDYFHPKKDIKVTEAYLRETGKGVGYTKTAPIYLFKKK